ncbi:MAG: rod shape-determining protein MreC [Thiothrix sp.]|nr:rod shape-determining protein MreC [Thiothrix sp.]
MEATINDIDHHSTPGLSFQFVVFSLIALTLMAFDYFDRTSAPEQRSNIIPAVRTGFNMVSYPLQVMVDAPFKMYDYTTAFFADHTLMLAENEKLRKQLLRYSVKYRDMQILEQQNERLRALMKAEKRPGYTFTMAEILSAAENRGRQVVTLNKGTRDGVFEKQVVVGQGGNIFGQVIEVTPFSSNVLLLTDRLHTIPVRHQRTGMKALANGTGKPTILDLKSVEATTDVREGDLFVSSGLDKLFPPDFPVARVLPDGVQYVPGSQFANIRAEPLLNFDDTREVLLLWRVEPIPQQMPAAVAIPQPSANVQPGLQAVPEREETRTPETTTPATNTPPQEPVGNDG